MNNQTQSIPGTTTYKRIANKIYASRQVTKNMNDPAYKRLIDEVIDLQSYGPLANSLHQGITYTQFPDKTGVLQIENGAGRTIIHRETPPEGNKEINIRLILAKDIDYEGASVFLTPEEY